MQLPDLPLRDFCPQLSVPLRLVRQHIRENLRATVVKEVETRGDASTTGCMRGTLAARFGSLRRWLKGLSNPQQEIVWSVMSGDGRAAARLLETTVGADYIRCGVCDGKVSSCVVMREAHESQPIDSRVALAHDEAPFVAIEEAAAGLENADPGPGPPPSGILLEEADPESVGELASDSEVPPLADEAADDVAVAAPVGVEIDGAGVKRHILLTGYARHLLSSECAPVAAERLRTTNDAGNLYKNISDPKWILRAILSVAGCPAPEEWPLVPDPRPAREDPPPGHETMHNVSGAARACAESIDAFRTRAPAADATQDVGLPLAPALRFPSSVHRCISAPPSMTQPPANGEGPTAASMLLRRNLDIRPRPEPAARPPQPASAAALPPAVERPAPPAQRVAVSPLVDQEDDLLADISDDDLDVAPCRVVPLLPAVLPAGPVADELLAAQANFVVDLDPVTGLPVAVAGAGMDPPPADESPVPMEVDNEGVDFMDWAEPDGLVAWENRRWAEQGSPVEPDTM
mmetsp:Transcript_25120/g.63150  ORF Transcript_25120/g.63150 Transcript_25120/m.63150 type:complete len:519 (-) Transcript_25120:1744-3300(-)